MRCDANSSMPRAHQLFAYLNLNAIKICCEQMKSTIAYLWAISDEKEAFSTTSLFVEFLRFFYRILKNFSIPFQRVPLNRGFSVEFQVFSTNVPLQYHKHVIIHHISVVRLLWDTHHAH